MKYLVCSEAAVETLHTDDRPKSSAVELGYGHHWAIVEGHSSADAITAIYGNGSARDGEKCIVVKLGETPEVYQYEIDLVFKEQT